MKQQATLSGQTGIETNQLVFKAGFNIQFLSEAPVANRFTCVVQPGSRTPMAHYHEHFDETVQCLKGITTLRLDGKTIQLRPGDSVVIPRGSVHQIANKTNDIIEFLCEIRPGVFGYAYFRDIEPLLNSEGLPDIERLKKIMKSYGLVPVIGLKQSLIFGILRIIRFFKR